METQTADYLVIGAGPAGLQLGYFLDRAGRDYLILEADPPACVPWWSPARPPLRNFSPTR